MASYKIEWKKSAQKELTKFGKDVIKRILKVVESLADDPWPRGSIKLTGTLDKYRFSVGDYRVIYHVRSSLLTIEIIKVGHRKEVYKKIILK